MNLNEIEQESIKEIILKEGNGRCDKVLFTIPQFNFDEIDKVYIGKPNRCMCGCSGKYYDKSDDVKVQLVINKLIRNVDKGIEVINDYIYSLDIGKTQYTIYLTEPK